MARLGNFGQLAIFELEDAKQLLIDKFSNFFSVMFRSPVALYRVARL